MYKTFASLEAAIEFNKNLDCVESNVYFEDEFSAYVVEWV